MTEQPQVGLQPVPQQVTVGSAQGPGGLSFVVVQILGPTGTHVSFLDVDAALAIAEQITVHARQARSGLIVAGGLPPVNGKAS